jgi:serine/threonine protein kinase
MLTGVHPFDLYGNSTDEEIEEQVLARKMPPLRNSPLTAHLSNDAIALIEQLLQWEAKKRLTAYQVLENPWVRGDTARTDKIANSDKRLSKYKAFKSKLEAKFFADMVSLSSSDDAESDVVDNHPTSLIEQAFHKLDPSHKGYVTTSDLQRVTKAQPSTERAVESSEEEQLSLSGFAGLMSEAMKNRYYPKGHIIYHEGEKGDVM